MTQTNGPMWARCCVQKSSGRRAQMPSCRWICATGRWSTNPRSGSMGKGRKRQGCGGLKRVQVKVLFSEVWLTFPFKDLFLGTSLINVVLRRMEAVRRTPQWRVYPLILGSHTCPQGEWTCSFQLFGFPFLVVAVAKVIGFYSWVPWATESIKRRQKLSQSFMWNPWSRRRGCSTCISPPA